MARHRALASMGARWRIVALALLVSSAHVACQACLTVLAPCRFAIGGKCCGRVVERVTSRFGVHWRGMLGKPAADLILHRLLVAPHQNGSDEPKGQSGEEPGLLLRGCLNSLEQRLFHPGLAVVGGRNVSLSSPCPRYFPACFGVGHPIGLPALSAVPVLVLEVPAQACMPFVAGLFALRCWARLRRSGASFPMALSALPHLPSQ